MHVIDPASIDLEQFLTDWHGAPGLPAAPLSGEFDWLPFPLRSWYELSARWSEPLVPLKRMAAPGQIARADGRPIFMKDPTGDWLWAFGTEGPSKVYEAELHGTWQEVPEGIDEFLLHNVINETVYGVRPWRECTAVENSDLDEVLSPLTEVSFGGWRWPCSGVRTFLSEVLVAEVSPAMNPRIAKADRSRYSEVRLAARAPENLAYLDDIPGVSWICSK